MDDRRNAERKYLNFFSQVTDRRTGRLLGYLIDLTTGGALLVGDHKLETGSLLHLQISLPEGYPKETIRVDANVAWTQPDREPEYYKSGLKMINPQSDDLNLLVRLIDDYGFEPR
jgi:hypothetical protein